MANVSGKRLRIRMMRTLGVTLVAATALLLWARIKIVTNTPRIVYADPEGERPEGLSPGGRAKAEGAGR